MHFLGDSDLPIDNNWVQNRIRPIALGRKTWPFTRGLRAGKRATTAMSSIHSAKPNGLDRSASMREVLERLPTQPASRITELMPAQLAAEHVVLSHAPVVKTSLPDAHGLPTDNLSALSR